jgi:hypothetical protein
MRRAIPVFQYHLSDISIDGCIIGLCQIFFPFRFSAPPIPYLHNWTNIHTSRPTQTLVDVSRSEWAQKIRFFCFLSGIRSNISGFRHSNVYYFCTWKLPSVLSGLLKKVLFLADSRFTNNFSGPSSQRTNLNLLIDLRTLPFLIVIGSVLLS